MLVPTMEGALHDSTAMPECSTKEPTIKDVFLAVAQSKAALSTLSGHVGKVQADISLNTAPGKRRQEK